MLTVSEGCFTVRISGRVLLDMYLVEFRILCSSTQCVAFGTLSEGLQQSTVGLCASESVYSSRSLRWFHYLRCHVRR